MEQWLGNLIVSLGTVVTTLIASYFALKAKKVEVSPNTEDIPLQRYNALQERLDKENRELANNLREANNTIKLLNDQLFNARYEINKYQSRLEAAMEKIDELESSIDKLTEKIKESGRIQGDQNEKFK